MSTPTYDPPLTLPKGGKLIPVFKKELGGWVEMEFDARFERHGVTWFRVMGGMGGNYDREDWVADLPGINVSLHDYHWRGRLFGHRYKSFEFAVKGELRRSLENAVTRQNELKEKILKLDTSIKKLKQALAD